MQGTQDQSLAAELRSHSAALRGLPPASPQKRRNKLTQHCKSTTIKKFVFKCRVSVGMMKRFWKQRVVMVVNTVNIINVIEMHTQKLLKWHVYFIMEKYGKN